MWIVSSSYQSNDAAIKTKKMKKLIIKMVFGSPIKGEKVVVNGLNVVKTTVPTSFLKTHPKWDNHLYKNVEILNA